MVFKRTPSRDRSSRVPRKRRTCGAPSEGRRASKMARGRRSSARVDVRSDAPSTTAATRRLTGLTPTKSAVENHTCIGKAPHPDGFTMSVGFNASWEFMKTTYPYVTSHPESEMERGLFLKTHARRQSGKKRGAWNPLRDPQCISRSQSSSQEAAAEELMKN